MTWTAASRLPVWRTARYTVVELPAEIDVANADALRDRLVALTEAERPARTPLVVDLSGTRFCDSAALSMLLRVRARLMPLGRRVYAVVPPSGLIRKVFDVAGITRLIPVCDDVGSAVALAVVSAVDDGERPRPSEAGGTVPGTP